MKNKVLFGDVLACLKTIDDKSIDLVYTDPPFNTGIVQEDNRTKIKYTDRHEDYISWVKQWVSELYRIMKPTATIYLHLDDHAAYLVRAHVLDDLFGIENYLSTIIWAYDYGGRAKDRWAAKHDTILVYAKNAGEHYFNTAEVDRLPYMSPPQRSGQKRAQDGKLPTDVWWMSIVGTKSSERVGYPNQKPSALVRRAVVASSKPGDVVLDCFAGSGTLGHVAFETKRSFVLIDKNQASIDTIKQRFSQNIDDIEFQNV